MKQKLINLIGALLLITVTVTIIYLFAFAGNGNYVAHLNINS